MNFKEELNSRAKEIEQYLQKYAFTQGKPEIIFESTSYSLFAGGKRIRPVLVIAGAECISPNKEDIIPIACAIEMIHTYSLIHDDLPCMDDDDLRRGKPTNHAVYGEAMALLAGDALLNMAYEVIFKGALNAKNKENYIKAANIIANSAGIYGMVAGQVQDMLCEGKKPNESDLNFIHTNKTGALLKAASTAGAVAAGADEKQLEALEKYGNAIGLMFQIVDDILDIIGDEKTLGKKVGADSVHEKMTYPAVYGINASKEKINELYIEAIEAIEIFGEKGKFLRELALYLSERTK